MKALRYFFCVVIPPVAVLLTGSFSSFLLSLVLTFFPCTFWIGGIIHAILVVNDYEATKRLERLVPPPAQP